MSTYYEFYVGLLKDDKIEAIGPYFRQDGVYHLRPILERSRSFISWNEFDSLPLPVEKMTDDQIPYFSTEGWDDSGEHHSIIHAAYAHGAQHPGMLSGCKRANGIGMEKSTFYQFKCWKCVGKPKYSKLKKGDVLVKSTHVAMYIGKGKMVEVSGGNWSAGSIATKKMSNSKYKGFSYVMRYTGY